MSSPLAMYILKKNGWDFFLMNPDLCSMAVHINRGYSRLL